MYVRGPPFKGWSSTPITGRLFCAITVTARATSTTATVRIPYTSDKNNANESRLMTHRQQTPQTTEKIGFCGRYNVIDSNRSWTMKDMNAFMRWYART